MKKDDTPKTRALGLDIGTSRIVLAKRNGDQFQFDSQLNAFLSIPYSKLTEAVLQKENVPYTVQGDEMIVHGTESERFADLLGREARRPMTRGLLNPAEPDGESQLRKIIDRLLGNENGDGQRLYFSIPASPNGLEGSLTYHEATIRRILSERNYDVRSINEGLAVVYAEMESSNYTGIGVSCGGGLCNVCLAYLSVPVLSFSLGKAGDFIDAAAASATGELATRVRITKESNFHFNSHFSDKIQQALSVYYEDMINSLVNGLKEAFIAARTLPKLGRPVPLVLSGGSVMPKGFRERFEKTFRSADFPVALSEVRQSETPLYSTAKGALVAALSEA